MSNKPNILLISLDAVRADHLSCYGYHKQTTPFLDILAEEGIRFEYAYTSSRWSLPAHASMFTGASVSKHGVGSDRTGIKHLADSRWRTLPEYLRGHGYYTLGFSNNTFVSRDFYFHRGFDHFRETWKLIDEGDALFLLFQRLGGHGLRTGRRRNLGHKINNLYFDHFDKRWNRGEKGARKTNRMFANWLKHLRLDHQPFFAFMQYLEPHSRYWPPQPFRKMFLQLDERRAKGIAKQGERAYDFLTGRVRLTEADFEVLKDLYDGQLGYLDSRLRELIEILKRHRVLDNTMIIITADHGECFGEHGWIGHASPSLYEPAVRVPLIIRYPPIYSAGELVSSPVSVLDIYATIADMFGNGEGCLRDQLQGLSLLPNQLENLEDRMVIIESLDTHSDAFARADPSFDAGQYDYFQSAGRWREYKYIQRSKGDPELYHIVEDPEEQINLTAKIPQLSTELQRRLDEWLASFDPCPPLQDDFEFEIAEEVRERLVALGYLEF